jgi:hypothetical protein
MSDADRDDAVSAATDLGGALLGTTVGFLIAGPPGALVAAGVAAGAPPLARIVLRRFNDSVAGKLTLMAQAMEAYRSASEEPVVERLSTTDEGLALLHRAVTAALSTASKGKLRALALVLADGALTESSTEMEELHQIVLTLDRVEAPQVALLAAFRPSPEDGSVTDWPPRTRPQLVSRVLAYERTIDAVIGGCRMTGLIREVEAGGLSYGGPEPFQITELGMRILGYMTEVASNADDGV